MLFLFWFNPSTIFVVNKGRIHFVRPKPKPVVNVSVDSFQLPILNRFRLKRGNPAYRMFNG